MAVGKDIIDKLINSLGIKKSEVKYSDDNFDKLFQKYIRKWQRNLTKDDHIASGKLYQAIGSENGRYGFKVKQNAKKIEIKMALPDYYQFTDTGRPPTSGGGTGILRKRLQGLKGWISQKGLVRGSGITLKQKVKLKSGKVKTYTRKLTAAQWNKQLAFLIARKIHREGFEGTNWFSREMPSFQKELNKEFAKSTAQLMKFTIKTFVSK